ncbi:PHD and RING finger domain-containing protein 1-like [Macrobrachium rosenbergii]|uniref:PHD and RING finger domain-containing protein 1-like n=1 Tax=Macrobrachium rosenbergii TaxID=79674 RepID=UPI0034D6636B
MGRHRKRVSLAKKNKATNPPAVPSGRKCSRTEAKRAAAAASSSSAAPPLVVGPPEKVPEGDAAVPVRSEVTEEASDTVPGDRSQDVAKRIRLTPSSFYSGRRRGVPKGNAILPQQNGLDGESSVSKHDSGGREDKNTKLPEQKVSMDSASGLGGKESEMEPGGLPDHGSTRGQSSAENGEKQLSGDETRLKRPRRSLRCAKIKRETPGDIYGLKSERDPCPICLRQMKGRVGTLESCAHAFCLPCIMKWSKANSSCPKDRNQYSEILAHHHFGDPVYRRIPVEKNIPGDHPESDSSFESEFSFPPYYSSDEDFDESDDDDDDDFFVEPEWTHCEICGRRDYPFRFSCCSVCSESFHSRCYDVSREELRKTRLGEFVCEACQEEEEGRN